MSSEPQLRRATTVDTPAVTDLVHSAYEKYVSRIGKPPGPMLQDYEQVLRQHDVYVLEDGGTIVGLLVLEWHDGGLTLDNVAVHPDYQGRGLGRRLLELAEAEARRAGLSSISLYTHELMTENIALYGRIGYVETERREDDGYRRVFMRKDLTK